MDLLSIRDVCNLMGVSRKTIYNRRKKGDVSFIDTPDGIRIDRAEAERVFKKKSAGNAVGNVTGNYTHDSFSLLSELLQEVRKIRMAVESLAQEKVSVITQPVYPSKIEQKPTSTTTPGRRGYNGSYEQRGLQVIEKGREAYAELQSELGSIPQKKQVAERAGISRGSVTKYWNEITA